MKKSFLLIAILSIVFSSKMLSQKNHKHFHNHHHSAHHHNLNFAGGLMAGLFLNEFFDLSHNHREMYFEYNYKKNNWRLTKDISNYPGFYLSNSRLTARFENPNGGRDFIVKRNRKGRWFIDAPRRLTQVLKKKVARNL